jgi:outer membrane protein assembly factor BamB
MTGCDLVAGFDPASGEKLWEVKGSTTECVTSAVTDGRLVFTSGGYPKNHVSAVRAHGSGEVVWEKSYRVYVPSMLLHGGHLYAVQDGGFALCLEAATGKEVWKGRLGGTFSASPVLVGDLIYATNEAGRTFLFRATPEAFRLVGENQLGDEVFATPTICGGRIYLRVAREEKGQRQEVLYCLGQGE